MKSKTILTSRCEHTKLLKVGKIRADAGVTVDDGQIEVVEHFKYIGSLKSGDGNCYNDIKSRIGMAKKIILDLAPIRRDRGIKRADKLVSSRSNDRGKNYAGGTAKEEDWTEEQANFRI